mmetsp:Transcript_34595/g.81555  ORF Transcript_34595/g.81555 Transcript_34595/m.81555 type:complete len:341 (-) Transcript_34595:1497-2519(-)
MKMALSRERVAIFFVVFLGTVWSSSGTKSFGTDVLVPPTTFTKRFISRSRSSFTNVRSGISEDSFLHLRGGSLSVPDDEEEEGNGIIVTKLRNLIRSILDISDDKIPFFSGFLRTFFKTVETVTGINILPQDKSIKKKKKEKTKNKPTKSETKKKKKVSDDDDSKARKPSKKKNSSKKKTSTATKKHLSTSIKSTNPNYRIQKELKSFIKSPPPNLSVQVGTNIRIWIVTMVGAKDTIYEGEVFKLRVEFPKDYPTVPPSVYFLKKFMPVHEHVYTNGDICLSLLGKGWRPTMSAQSIAVSILSILSSAQSKSLPMDNAQHATNKPGQYQKDWVYHDDRC